jgi:hypothetical protein
MYRYPGPATGTFTEVFVGAATNMTRHDFWTEVLKTWGGFDLALIKKDARQPYDRPSIPFEAFAFTQGMDDAVTYFAFAACEPKTQVAIVYGVPQAKAGAPEVSQVIDLSLRSLAVGVEALELHNRWQFRRAPRR